MLLEAWSSGGWDWDVGVWGFRAVTWSLGLGFGHWGFSIYGSGVRGSELNCGVWVRVGDLSVLWGV